jgi:hypothetical protein
MTTIKIDNLLALDDAKRMLNRRLDSEKPDAIVDSPSKPLAHGTAFEAETVVSLVTLTFNWPNERISPSLSDLNRDTARFSHLKDLINVATQAIGEENLSLAAEITNSVRKALFLSLASQPVHPRMFSSAEIFSTEGIRLGVEEALSDRLSREKRHGLASRLAGEALAITLENWGVPRYAGLEHIEMMAATLSDGIDNGRLNASELYLKKRSLVTNLIAITESALSTVGRFHGEGCQMISRLDLPVEYTKPVPEYLIEHHLLTSSEEELSDFFNAAIAMIHFGSVAPPLKTEPGDFEIKDFPMNYASMLETGRRILVAMYQLSVPTSSEAQVTLAAYGKDKLNLPESIDKQVSDMVRSTRGFFIRNSEQE